MSEPPQRYDLYRCTAHGGSKDWAIAITPDGDISILNCATGQAVRRTHIPRSAFANATAEVDRRVREKGGKGYEFLGAATVESNRLKAAPETIASPTSTFDEHWEIIRPLDYSLVEDRLGWAASQLFGYVAPDLVEYDHDQVLLRTAQRGQGINHWWALGYSAEGGIQTSGRGGGKIMLNQGLLPRLIMLFMWRSFPGSIQLSGSSDEIRHPQISKDDDFVGQDLFDYERVIALGERLGLCLGRISLLQPTEKGRSAFWF